LLETRDKQKNATLQRSVAQHWLILTQQSTTDYLTLQSTWFYKNSI